MKIDDKNVIHIDAIDLDVLEIFKNKFFSHIQNVGWVCIGFSRLNNEEFDKVKEWLEK